MGTVATIEELIARAAADGFCRWRVALPAREVVYFKSVLEAYPGLGVVLAEPRRRGAPRARSANDGRAELTVVATPEAAADVTALFADMAAEAGLALLPAPEETVADA